MKQKQSPLESYEKYLRKDFVNWNTSYTTRKKDDKPERVWVGYTPPQHKSVKVGWKLHISSILEDAPEVLKVVTSYLSEKEVAFKFLNAPYLLAEFNSSVATPSAAGKFITIYPQDENEAVDIAEMLHEKTKAFRGPRILSDAPFALGSLVHYRWGGFTAKYIQTIAGEVTLAIHTSDNHYVPDRRVPFYSNTPGVKNPFPGSKAILKLDSELIKNNRYLLGSLISRSVRGDVFLAIDLKTKTRCILKLARIHSIVDAEGRDSVQRLGYEKKLLEYLEDLPSIPNVYDDFLTEDGNYVIVLEDIPQVSLADIVKKNQNANIFPSETDVLNLAINLTTVVDKVHQKGIIHTDIKLHNIISVSEDDLRLIDFDSAYNVQTKEAPLGWGTDGYNSPQLIKRQTPRIEDDIYSIGAVLLYYAHNLTSHHVNIRHKNLKKKLDFINPSLGKELQQIILKCISSNPKQRYHSARELLDALSKIKTSLKNNLTVLPQQLKSSHFHQQAIRLGKHLVTEYYDVTNADISFASNIDTGVSLYDLRGSAGCVLALAELFEATKDPFFEAPLRRTAESLAKGTTTTYNQIPGLFVGESGICFALMKAGLTLQDQSLIQASYEHFKHISKMPYESMDLLNGTAGRLITALLLWQHIRKQDLLEIAETAAKAIMGFTHNSPECPIWWPCPELSSTSGNMTYDKKTIYLGYSHGSAGIADALMNYYYITKDQSVLEIIHKVANLLKATAQLSNSGAIWPSYHGDNDPSPPFWCHGGVGIGKFFLNGAVTGLFQDGLKYASLAAESAKNTTWSLPIFCHGIPGNIDYILDVYQSTGKANYLKEAKRLTQILDVWVEEILNGSTLPSDFKPLDYLNGLPGIIITYLRLTKPTSSQHMFSFIPLHQKEVLRCGNHC